MNIAGLKDKHKELIERNNLPMFSRVCSNCLHYKAQKSCKAFARIPDEIWLGENDHTKPVSGDHGIRFEPFEPATAKLAA